MIKGLGLLFVNEKSEGLHLNGVTCVVTVLPFPEIHINGIIQYVAICVWLLSLSIMQLGFTQLCINNLFLLLCRIPVYGCITIHPPVEGHLSYSQFLAKIERSCYKYLCAGFCECKFSFYLGIYIQE